MSALRMLPIRFNKILIIPLQDSKELRTKFLNFIQHIVCIRRHNDNINMNSFKIILFYHHEQSKAWVELKWPYCFTCKDETTMCKGRCNRLVATWLVHQNSLFLITFNIVCHSRIEFNFGLKTSFCWVFLILPTPFMAR